MKATVISTRPSRLGSASRGAQRRLEAEVRLPLGELHADAHELDRDQRHQRPLPISTPFALASQARSAIEKKK